MGVCIIEESKLCKWDFFKPKSGKIQLSNDRDVFFSQFDGVAREISAATNIAGSGELGPLSKNWMATNLARRLIYQLGCHCKKHRWKPDLRKHVKGIVTKNGGRLFAKSSSASSNNVFYLCYRGVFPTDQVISSTERSRAAQLLSLADSHNVKAKYLVGFILQNSLAEGEGSQAKRSQIAISSPFSGLLQSDWV